MNNPTSVTQTPGCSGTSTDYESSSTIFDDSVEIVPTAGASSPGMQRTDKYCYCKQGEHGKMVGCDNDSSSYQWFNLECLNLKNLPTSSKWHCPDCRKLSQKN